MNLGLLKGKVALITGGAQGLGEALCQRFNDEGATVAVADINLESAKLVADKLDNALAIACDVTDYSQCEVAFQAVIKKYGKLDILISNAAILLSGAINEFDADKWKKVIDVNLCGNYNIVKACADHFMERKEGAIVQVNSKSGKKGSFRNSAYAASKFGGIGLVQSLALEFAPFNVRINAVCPGNMLSSPLWVNSLFKQYAKNQNCSEEEIRQKYLAQVPMGRGCEYEDVANVCTFLCSDLASYMTGQAINVTGGQEMR